MHDTQSYEVNPKENFYFLLKVLFTIIIYGIIGVTIFLMYSTMPAQNLIGVMFALIFYIVMIGLFLLFRMGFLVGYIRGNSVKITEYQFPDLHKILVKQSSLLGLSKVPETYILEQGGFLNAFATRFIGRDYIVLYAEIVEEAYNNNIESLEFIIAHELGHVKRKHISKNLLLFPSVFIPFLNSAYSRACEYTCDNIGAALSPKGAIPALLLLSSGKSLFRRINVDNFVRQQYNESGFWMSINELFSSHPMLVKRVGVFHDSPQIPINTSRKQFVAKTSVEETINIESTNNIEKADTKEKSSSDHSKYMPS